MKVLFAVNNESISESITKKYQQEYKEIISVKNVYYFNAIIKELQRDKNYDRIVVSEDLQPFSNNNYEQIDKFIFEKMDNISDEATNQNGNDIPIILICTDRREKSDPLLVKLFGIGVYNALIGKDRSITNVCELINHPRTKKEAKVYYNVDSEDVDYKAENESDVSEVEIQNILNHYKKLGRNEEKYIESFDHIASQYTDSQLKLIIKFLPINVKAVLEGGSEKYKELVEFSKNQKTPKYNDYQKVSQKNVKYNKPQEDNQLEIIKQNLSKNKITAPVIIPSSINTNQIKKVQPVKVEDVKPIDEVILDEEQTIEQNNTESINDTNNKIEPEQPKRRGRPKKIKNEEPNEQTAKRGRGRPKKQVDEIEKQPENKEEIINNETSPLNLFELDEEENIPQKTEDMILPGLDDEFLFEQPEENVTETAQAVENNKEEIEQSELDISNQNKIPTTTEEHKENNMADMLTKEKKVVSFVGTSKNGTSFLVNNIAELLSQKGINTAILDLTKNKNSYYIYTENEENLRKIAYSCMENLKNGNAKGIEVHKNLTVYTTVPNQDYDESDYMSILQTLMQNHSLVILDCDFETNYNYFSQAQEIYLIQSLDILTIQPLTAFLRNLKAKNVLNQEKIRVVLNKVVNLKTANEKVIIGGMAYYNDPAMSFMTELFNKDTVKYCTIPFDEQAYIKYLDGIINCKITLNGYSKNFMSTLNTLADMVYPLISNNKIKNNSYSNYTPKNTFSQSMNDTLAKMKNNY